MLQSTSWPTDRQTAATTSDLHSATLHSGKGLQVTADPFVLSVNMMLTTYGCDSVVLSTYQALINYWFAFLLMPKLSQLKQNYLKRRIEQ